jgi:hypothetical protein
MRSRHRSLELRRQPWRSRFASEYSQPVHDKIFIENPAIVRRQEANLCAELGHVLPVSRCAHSRSSPDGNSAARFNRCEIEVSKYETRGHARHALIRQDHEVGAGRPGKLFDFGLRDLRRIVRVLQMLACDRDPMRSVRITSYIPGVGSPREPESCQHQERIANHAECSISKLGRVC